MAEREAVRVLVFSASLRAESLNTRLANLARGVIENHGGTVDLATMEQFRSRIEDVDAFVIASPEYNGSFPGVLKNVIDWVSRYRPQPFNAKQGMLISASPSMVGGNRGLWALRVPLEHLGARMYPDMFSLAQAHQAFAPDGRIANQTLADRLDKTFVGFLDLVEAAKRYPCVKKAWVEFLGEHPDAATDRSE